MYIKCRGQGIENECSENLRENNLFTNIRQGKKEKGSRFSLHILEEERSFIRPLNRYENCTSLESPSFLSQGTGQIDW